MLENRLIEMLNLRDHGISLARIAEKLGLSKRTIRTWDSYVNLWEKYSMESIRSTISSLKEDTALKLLASSYKSHEHRQNYLIGQRYKHRKFNNEIQI